MQDDDDEDPSPGKECFWVRYWRQLCVLASFAAAAAVAVSGPQGRAADLVGPRNLRPIEIIDTLLVEKAVYVPIYPSLYSNTSGTRSIPMLVTLSLRNVSAEVSIVVSGVDVYDSDGRVIATYLDSPHELGPMQTADFVADRWDPAGGSGANFVVTWGLVTPGPDLLVEAVMQPLDPETGISFTTRGHVISQGSGAGSAQPLRGRPLAMAKPSVVRRRGS